MCERLKIVNTYTQNDIEKHKAAALACFNYRHRLKRAQLEVDKSCSAARDAREEPVHVCTSLSASPICSITETDDDAIMSWTAFAPIPFSSLLTPSPAPLRPRRIHQLCPLAVVSVYGFIQRRRPGRR